MILQIRCNKICFLVIIIESSLSKHNKKIPITKHPTSLQSVTKNQVLLLHFQMCIYPPRVCTQSREGHHSERTDGWIQNAELWGKVYHVKENVIALFQYKLYALPIIPLIYFILFCLCTQSKKLNHRCIFNAQYWYPIRLYFLIITTLHKLKISQSSNLYISSM